MPPAQGAERAVGSAGCWRHIPGTGSEHARHDHVLDCLDSKDGEASVKVLVAANELPASL